MELETPSIIFCIDTNSYSGNFHREMTAWITGLYGDCEVGKEIAEAARVELGSRFEEFYGKVQNDTDEHGTARPNAMGATPGFFNDGLGNEWPESMADSPEVLETYQRTAKEHKHHEDVPGHFPSYQSVEISFYDRPKPETVELMRERARSYQDQDDNTIKVTGFRLVKRHEVTEELEVWE